MITQAKSADLFKPFAAPNQGPTISHFFFSDDAIIIGDLTESNDINIKAQPFLISHFFIALTNLMLRFNLLQHHPLSF